MSNPKFLRSLPQEAVQLVREYTSDRVAPHPTAPLIKALTFEYLEEEEPYGVYLPARLSVSNGVFLMPLFDGPWSRNQVISDNRAFYLPDFGESDYDGYITYSTLHGGFVLGRVL